MLKLAEAAKIFGMQVAARQAAIVESCFNEVVSFSEKDPNLAPSGEDLIRMVDGIEEQIVDARVHADARGILNVLGSGSFGGFDIVKRS